MEQVLRPPFKLDDDDDDDDDDNDDDDEDDDDDDDDDGGGYDVNDDDDDDGSYDVNDDDDDDDMTTTKTMTTTAMTVMIFMCVCLRHSQSLPILTDNRDTAYLQHNGFLFNTDAMPSHHKSFSPVTQTNTKGCTEIHF